MTTDNASREEAARLTSMLSVAAPLAEFRDALMAQGFTREEAFVFVRDWFAQMRAAQ